ncbi:hypothetical protein C0J52_03618 [Blattella germanica]|nr:hypothetical protein C0J52_03618 [Blattella germanica]
MYKFTESRTVAQWTKAVCFGSGSRDARWFESPWGNNFLMEFGQCMGPVPTQHREESGELRLVADSGYGY